LGFLEGDDSKSANESLMKILEKIKNPSCDKSTQKK